jgi:hypothetical protein
MNMAARNEPNPLAWHNEELGAIALLFNDFSKKVRERVEHCSPVMQATQNAMLAGFLERMTEYLRRTYENAPDQNIVASLEEIRKRTYEKVVVVSGLDRPHGVFNV